MLARLWLNAKNRRDITRAGDAVDQMLREDANRKGFPAHSTTRQLIVPPLVVEFTFEEEDRKVSIWSVRHIGELTNGG
jgi:hypothetical protein